MKEIESMAAQIDKHREIIEFVEDNVPTCEGYVLNAPKI